MDDPARAQALNAAVRMRAVVVLVDGFDEAVALDCVAKAQSFVFGALAREGWAVGDTGAALMVIGKKALLKHLPRLKELGREARWVPDEEFVPVDFRFGHGTPTRSSGIIIIPVGLGGEAYAEFKEVMAPKEAEA